MRVAGLARSGAPRGESSVDRERVGLGCNWVSCGALPSSSSAPAGLTVSATPWLLRRSHVFQALDHSDPACGRGWRRCSGCSGCAGAAARRQLVLVHARDS